MEKYTIEQDVLLFDAETTGLTGKNDRWDTDFDLFPNLVSLSWIFRGVEKNYIIYPENWEIPSEATAIHGITTQYALEHGTKIDVVLAEFAEDCLVAAFVCAHNIYFDVSTIKANVLKHLGKGYYEEYKFEDALYKGKRIDTMRKTIKFVSAPYPNGRKGIKFPTLVEMFEKAFPGESFEAHNSLNDCRALQKCLPVLMDLGLIVLEIREYDENNKPIYNNSPKVDAKVEQNKIDFNDPSPVIIPGANGENIPDEKPDIMQFEKELPDPDKGLKATERTGNNPLLDIDEF